MAEKDRYRVFISYSRDDKELVERIIETLKEIGLRPMWDQSFTGGGGFPEQIRKFIAHSHVFVPIITERSSERGWVHQEIGFAMAQNIPVLPICRGALSEGMIRELQAVVVDGSPESIKNKLSKRTFDNLIRRVQKSSRVPYESAEYHEERTMMMVEYAQGVLELGESGRVRQRGALSSFHIPSEPVTHPAWKERYGAKRPNMFRCQLLLKERMVLEEHAKDKGCSLIIDPYLGYGQYGKNARKARLECLLKFLRNPPTSDLKIAINSRMAKAHNWTSVGDWFLAESVSGALGQGYSQTIFTRHAPTVLAGAELFDRELDELLKAQQISAKSSVAFAIEVITKILSDLKQETKNKKRR